MNLRPAPQFATPPPLTYREPSTRSASEEAAISRGTSSGSCEKSQSISSTSSAPSASARWKPAMYAGPSPLLVVRWSTETRSCSAESRSASSPVPSGDPSSMTRIRSSASRRSSSAVTIGSRFSRSLYVGRQTVARMRRLDGASPWGGAGFAGTGADSLGTAPMIAAVALPRNAEVIEQLELLADMLELEGTETFRVLAYRRAAQRIGETGGSIAQLALDGKAKELQGIGKTIEEKIVQIVETGEIEALTKRKARIPRDVVAFMRLPGLGPKTARRIWLELDVTTLEGLREAAEHQRLRTLSGLGPKVEENVLKALKERSKPKAPARPLLGNGLPAVLAAVEALRAHPAAEQVSEAGSVRRRRETFRDLDIIATATDATALIDAFTGFDWVDEVAAKGGTKATVVSHDGLRFDLRVVPPECYGNLLQHFTGSKNHNVAMREEAQRRGLSISEYGITEAASGDVHTFRTEEELYEWLGYQFVPPELREAAGELEAASRGDLPVLVEEGDLRGGLHAQTQWY